jgi:hypothetical protein
VLRQAKQRKAGPANLSQDGINLLKCAFAAPDFLDDAGAGLPLGGDQKVLLKKHRLETSITPLAVSANQSNHYLILPTAGQAVWSCVTNTASLPSATQAWTPVSFGDSFGANGLFGASGDARAANVNAFRYAALSAELKSTAPLQTANGTIIASKINVRSSMAYKTANFATFNAAAGTNPVLVKATATTASPPIITTSFVDSATAPATLTMSSVLQQYSVPVLNGLEVTGVAPLRAFSGHINDGCYSVAVRGKGTEFIPVMENCAKLTDPNMYGVLDGDYLGIDSEMQGLYFRIDIPQDQKYSMRLRIWACVEYLPVVSSPLYEYSRFPPARDELALSLYQRYAKELPIAVIAALNDSAWSRAWAWIKAALGAVSFIPGPVGMVAGAAAGLATAIDAVRL